MFTGTVDERMGVYFVCQKCRKALQVTSGLEDSTLLSAFQSKPLSSHLDAQYPQREKQAMDALAESFVVLPGTTAAPAAVPDSSHATDEQTNTQWNEKMLALTKVFEVISDKCQLDHPLCGPCAEELHRHLIESIQTAENSHAVYQKTLEEFENQEKTRLPSQETNTQELTAKEAALEAELKRIREEREAIKLEEEQLQQQLNQLTNFERRFWSEYQEFVHERNHMTKERGALQQRVESAQGELERLRRTNVYDDAFHIYYDGHFGTINGFRLGRLPSQPVDWSEISAALGQVILLLKTLADQCNFKFSQYRLLPMGSFSKIAKLSDLNTAYELYGSQDFSVGKLFWYRRFDTALVWLLECVQEFGEYATNLDTNFKLKYEISTHTIGGHSVKMQFNNDASWTKAMKYLLSNVKFILAWVSKHKDH